MNKLWRKLGPEFTTDWARIKPQVSEVLAQGRSHTVNAATGYVDDVLAETRQTAPATGRLAPTAFLATAPDGRAMDTLIDQPIIWTKSAIGEGLTADAALARTGHLVTALTLTVLADTRRSVYGVDIAQRPQLTGYVRMLNPPSCERCVLLAGKWFRWNQGFARHPRCDCQHIPAAEDLAGDLRTDPYEYFNSLAPNQQDRLFGAKGAQAVRDGADIYRVGNVRMRGLATVKGRLRYGTPARLTVDDVYRLAPDRATAIRMLEREGYVLPRGQVAIHYSPGVKSDAQILAAGRGRGTYRIGGQSVTTRRAARFDAAATGVRDPLNRHTMTAAERRLYDASYRLQYARRNGTIPRSVGLNSADVAAGARGLTATPARLNELEAYLERQISRIQTGSSTHRLYVALRLDDEAAAAAMFERITGAVSGGGAKSAASAGGAGGKPPRRPGGSAFDGAPDPSDRNAWNEYWRRRQAALGIDAGGDVLTPQEIDFLERFLPDNQIRWIPKDRRSFLPTNDFVWVSNGSIPVELKSTGPKYQSIRNHIHPAVMRAQQRGVVKENFIINLGQARLTDKLRRQLALFNQRSTSTPIRRLYVMSADGLEEIRLA